MKVQSEFTEGIKKTLGNNRLNVDQNIMYAVFDGLYNVCKENGCDNKSFDRYAACILEDYEDPKLSELGIDNPEQVKEVINTIEKDLEIELNYRDIHRIERFFDLLATTVKSYKRQTGKY
jgi:hypothetical protein